MNLMTAAALADERPAIANFFVLAMQPAAQHLAGHGVSMGSWGWRQP